MDGSEHHHDDEKKCVLGWSGYSGYKWNFTHMLIMFKCETCAILNDVHFVCLKSKVRISPIQVTLNLHYSLIKDVCEESQIIYTHKQNNNQNACNHPPSIKHANSLLLKLGLSIHHRFHIQRMGRDSSCRHYSQQRNGCTSLSSLFSNLLSSMP
jgi:hypothetical protein